MPTIHNDPAYQAMSAFERFKQHVLTDPEANAAYEASRERNKILDALLFIRHAQGLSAREVSRRMGVSDATVRRLEAEGSDPTISLVQLYARAVGYRLQLDLKASEQ
jgi:HTH-type transcriptional regulator / antitoxin HipB